MVEIDYSKLPSDYLYDSTDKKLVRKLKAKIIPDYLYKVCVYVDRRGDVLDIEYGFVNKGEASTLREYMLGSTTRRALSKIEDHMYDFNYHIKTKSKKATKK